MSTLNGKGDFGSRPHRTQYEVVNCNGVISQQKFATASEAAAFAKYAFPDQEQDEDRAGKGWDIQVVGCDQ